MTLNDKVITGETKYFFLYSISYAWYAMIGTFGTFIIGYLSSLIFKEEPKLDKNLYISLISNNIKEEHDKNVHTSQELKPIDEKIYRDHYSKQ